MLAAILTTIILFAYAIWITCRCYLKEDQLDKERRLKNEFIKLNDKFAKDSEVLVAHIKEKNERYIELYNIAYDERDNFSYEAYDKLLAHLNRHFGEQIKARSKAINQIKQLIGKK